MCPSHDVVAAHADGLSIRASLSRALMFGSGRVVGQLLNVAFLPLILRFISPAEFGAFTFLQTVALVWGVVMSLGLPTTFVSQYARADHQKDDGSRLLGACLLQQLIFGGALLAFGLGMLPVISSRLAADTPPGALALLFAAEFVANHVLIIARWQVMTGRHSQVSLVSSVRSATFLAVALPCVSVIRLGVMGLAVADLFSDIAAALVCSIGTRAHLRLRLKSEDVRATIRLGLPAMPDTILFWVTVSTPFYFLRRAGLTAGAGAFGLAWRLASVVDLLGNSFAVGSTGELLRSGATSSAQRMFGDTMGLVGLATLALSTFSPEILRWFFPSALTSAIEAIPLACLGSYFLSAYYFEWVGLSGGRRTVGLTLAAAAGTLAAAAGFFFLPISSAPEAAGVYAISLFAMWLAARWLRTDARFGTGPAIVAGGLAATTLGESLQRFPFSAVGFISKTTIFAGIAVLLLFRTRTPKH